MKTTKILTIMFASFILTSFAFDLTLAVPQLKANVKTEKTTYYLREEVNILGNVTFDGALVDKGLAAVEVHNPLGRFFARTHLLGPIGTQTFDMEIQIVTLCDNFGNPLQTAVRGNTAYFKVKVKNNGAFPRTATITATIYDNDTNPIGFIASEDIEIFAGATYEFAQSVYIDHWVANGTGTIYASVFSDWPSQYGYPYCPEKAATFAIRESTYDTTLPGQAPQQPPTPNGTFNIKLKLSPNPMLGTYVIYATAWYQGYSTPQPALTTFRVLDTADFGSKDASTTITSNCENNIEGSIFTPDKTGTVYKVEAYVRMSGGNFKAAIYRASDGARIAYSISKTGPSNGVWTWILINLDYNGTIVAGTPYLIALWADSSCELGGKTDPTNPGRFKAQTYGDWPQQLTGLTTDNHLHDIFASYKVKAPPRAAFVITPPIAAPGYQMRFDASPSTAEGYNDTITNYKWDFGDTQQGSGKIVYYTYPSTNNYTVTLNVTDKEGFWNITTRIAIVMLIHDVAVLNISCLTDIYNDWTVQVTVKIKNKGTVSETFNVTLNANDTFAGRTTITNLGAYSTTTKTISWDTTGLIPLANYNIEVIADTVPGETNTADNSKEFGPIFVRLMGDTRFDRKIDILDVVIVTGIYGAKSTDPNWNIMADLTPDGKIDILDVVRITNKYGQTY